MAAVNGCYTRPPLLDQSALSPDEYHTYHEFSADFEREVQKRGGGSMRFAEAALVIRRWFDFSAELEDEIRCFFPQQIQLGGMRLGSSLAILRLLAHARYDPSRALSHDYIFTQTTPLPPLVPMQVSNVVPQTLQISQPPSSSGQAIGTPSPGTTKLRINPFRLAPSSDPRPTNDTLDSGPPSSLPGLRASDSMPSLTSAAAPLVDGMGGNRSPRPPNLNPFRNRPASQPDQLTTTSEVSSWAAPSPISPPLSTLSSPPLPPRPSAKSVSDIVASATLPPPKHVSQQPGAESAIVKKVTRRQATMKRSDSSPAPAQKDSASSAPTPSKPPKPKIQSATGLGAWIIPHPPSSTSSSPASGWVAGPPIPQPKLTGSTHLGMDTLLRRRESVTGSPALAGYGVLQSPGIGNDTDPFNNAVYELTGSMGRRAGTKARSDGGSITSISMGGGGGINRLGPGGVPMNISIETIASSASAANVKAPKPPPPKRVTKPLDTHSQPDSAMTNNWIDELGETQDSVGKLSGAGGSGSGPGLGRSKTVGHTGPKGKGPAPAPPPRRPLQMPQRRGTASGDVAKDVLPSGEIYNSGGKPLEEIVAQPSDSDSNAWGNTTTDGPSTTLFGGGSSSIHRRATSLNLGSGSPSWPSKFGSAISGSGSPLSLRNLKVLESQVKRDGKTVVNDLKAGWEVRHGKSEERAGLVDGDELSEGQRSARSKSGRRRRGEKSWTGDTYATLGG